MATRDSEGNLINRHAVNRRNEIDLVPADLNRDGRNISNKLRRFAQTIGGCFDKRLLEDNPENVRGAKLPDILPETEQDLPILEMNSPKVTIESTPRESGPYYSIWDGSVNSEEGRKSFYDSKTKTVSHNKVNVGFEVDSNVEYIIRYIMKNYSLDVTTIASCEGLSFNEVEHDLMVKQDITIKTSQDAYILCHVRNLNSFDEMIREIFNFESVSIEYRVEDISRTFRISWNPEDTKWLNDHLKENI